jgi:hypothetical protein
VTTQATTKAYHSGTILSVGPATAFHLQSIEKRDGVGMRQREERRNLRL